MKINEKQIVEVKSLPENEEEFKSLLFSAYLTGQTDVRNTSNGKEGRSFKDWYTENIVPYFAAMERYRYPVPFTRTELQDLERLTAGTSLEWCQKLNAKFEKALGIKVVKTDKQSDR